MFIEITNLWDKATMININNIVEIEETHPDRITLRMTNKSEKSILMSKKDFMVYLYKELAKNEVEIHRYRFSNKLQEEVK